MTLFDFVKDLFKDGTEFFLAEKLVKAYNGISVTRDTRILRDCSIALITCSTPEEWYNTCRQLCPVGTVIEDYNENWEKLYNDLLLLARVSLTKQLLLERTQKSAKTLLDILERRDSSRWGKESKQTTVDVSNDKDLNVKITMVE